MHATKINKYLETANETTNALKRQKMFIGSIVISINGIILCTMVNELKQFNTQQLIGKIDRVENTAQ